MKIAAIITTLCLLCLTIGGGVFWYRLETGEILYPQYRRAIQAEAHAEKLRQIKFERMVKEEAAKRVSDHSIPGLPLPR